MVPEDPRGRGAGQAGVARPGAVDGRAVDQLGSGPGPPPSQLRIVSAGRARPRPSCRPSDPLQRPRERRRSIRPNTATVKHHLARDCQASPGTGHMPTHHLVSTFSTVLKARCARRGPSPPTRGRRCAPKHRPGRGATGPPARADDRAGDTGRTPDAAHRLRPWRATAATAHAPDPTRPPRPGPHRPPPVPAARAGEEVASSRRPSVEPRKATLKGAPKARRTRWRKRHP